MKINIIVLMSLFIVLFQFSSCGNDDAEMADEQTSEENNEVVVDDDFVTNTQDITFQDAVKVVYSDDLVVIENPFEDDGVTIVQNNGDIIVTSTNTSTEINYVLSGTIKDGSFKLYSDNKFGLILNGVSLINSDGPAINIQSGKKATINVVDGTSNRLVDNANYVEDATEDMKAAFFSEGKLVFNGSGNLLVYGMYKHGICSDDYILINDGNIVVKTAIKDGIHVNDYFRIDGGSLNVTSSSDGIECEEGYIQINGGDLSVNSIEDGIKTSYDGTDTTIEPRIDISSGTVTVSVSGQASKAIKSKGDIVIAEGDLILNTSGDAYYDTSDADISSSAGIKCDGNLLLDKGNVTIVSSGSGGKGINVDGTLVVNDATVTVITTGGQFKYGSDDTAAKAIKSEGNLTINGGTIVIKTSGVEAEGLESKSILTINGGTVEIEAYDDCINASNHIEITGGNIYCQSATNDGIDSNGTLTISGGTIVSVGSTAPEEGFDCDNNRFQITGGTLVGVGGATSTPTASVSTQYSVIYGTTGSEGQLIHIESTNASTGILTFKVPRSYSQMILLFSSPDMAANTGYTIYSGGSVSGGTDFHGLYSNATYTKGNSSTTFSTSSKVTNVGSSNTGPGGRN